jgi:hypothetical protein
MAVGFDISGVVCLVPASLVVSGEAPVGCLQPYFHWFFPLSRYFTDWSWLRWFFFFLPFFQHCCIWLLRLFICCISVEEFVFGIFVN